VGSVVVGVVGGRTEWRITGSECVTRVVLAMRMVEVLLLILVLLWC